MTGIIIFGAIAALATGIAIGTQATLSSRVGALLGNVRTGLFTNFFGGVVAGLMLLVITLLQGKTWWQMPSSALIMLITAGLLGIAIITGVSFSLQRTGVAAGLASIILGQLAISVIVDTKGMGGAVPIPLTWQRVVGLIVVAGGVYLLLPKS